ncbi:hypothetical protein ACFSX7_10010 [Camelimonas lactis]
MVVSIIRNTRHSLLRVRLRILGWILERGVRDRAARAGEEGG